jgi:hypothetical protein
MFSISIALARTTSAAHSRVPADTTRVPVPGLELRIPWSTAGGCSHCSLPRGPPPPHFCGRATQQSPVPSRGRILRQVLTSAPICPHLGGRIRPRRQTFANVEFAAKLPRSRPGRHLRPLPPWRVRRLSPASSRHSGSSQRMYRTLNLRAEESKIPAFSRTVRTTQNSWTAPETSRYRERIMTLCTTTLLYIHIYLLVGLVNSLLALLLSAIDEAARFQGCASSGF